jgi:hypothetical protein
VKGVAVGLRLLLYGSWVMLVAALRTILPAMAGSGGVSIECPQPCSFFPVCGGISEKLRNFCPLHHALAGVQFFRFLPFCIFLRVICSFLF